MKPARKRARPDRSARPTLRELEVFRSVVLSGKTTAAAHYLHISQPAVSRTLSQLEARRGKALFRREGNRLVPTAEALALNQELEPIFEVLERLDAPADRDLRKTPLRIVAPASLAHHFLVHMIAGYTRHHDSCPIHLEIGSSPSVIASVADGLADVGLTNGSTAHAGIRLEPFLRTRAVCVLAGTHALAKRHVIKPEDLEGEPFIALTRRFSSRSVIDRIFREAHVQRRIVVEASTTVSAVGFVQEGVGVTIVNPFPVYDGKDGAVVFRAFEPEIIYATNFVLPASAPKPEARRFIDFVTAQRGPVVESKFMVAA